MRIVSTRLTDDSLRFDDLQESGFLIPQITQYIVRSGEIDLRFLRPVLLHQCIYHQHQSFFHLDSDCRQRKFAKQNLQAIHLRGIKSRTRFKQVAEETIQILFPPKFKNFQLASLSEVFRSGRFKRSSAERATVVSLQREGVIRNHVSAG